MGEPQTIPQFTSGPWLIHAKHRLVVQADGAFAKLTVIDGKVEGDDLPTTICLLRDPGETFSEDETLANGFLIAAAPEGYEAGEEAIVALNAMMDAWLDYHDTRSLTQPVTGAAGNAFDKALAARDKLEAFITKARGGA